MTLRTTSERSDDHVLPKDFDANAGPAWTQPWFWLAVVGLVGIVAMTITI